MATEISGVGGLKPPSNKTAGQMRKLSSKLHTDNKTNVVGAGTSTQHLTRDLQGKSSSAAATNMAKTASPIANKDSIPDIAFGKKDFLDNPPEGTRGLKLDDST